MEGAAEDEDAEGWAAAWAGCGAEDEEEAPAAAPEAEGEPAEEPAEEAEAEEEPAEEAEGEEEPAAQEPAAQEPEDNDAWAWAASGEAAPLTPPAVGAEPEEEVGEGEAAEEAAAEEWEEEEGEAEGEEAVEGADSKELEDMAKMMEMAESVGNADAAFEFLNAAHDQEGTAERELLDRLQREFGRIWKHGEFELEAFGSFVTDLGLPSAENAKRSDLDAVILFRGKPADSEANSVRSELVGPTIDRLSTWLNTQPDFTVTSVVKKARVPIVTFDTDSLSVDISVQQPWGVLNSWHLRDLCESGCPGRLKALVRLIKMWAKSKSIHTAKDGALSSYGYAILAASFLAARGVVKALLPSERGADTSCYISNDGALEYVLAKAGGEEPEGLWEAPQAGGEQCMDAQKTPTELFVEWLSWMQGAVLAFVEKAKGLPSGCACAPIYQRHIVSVRPRTQAQLLQDLQKWTPKRDHWMPSSSNEVFLTIEEPLNGENVSRSVRAAGFWAIVKEVHRARAAMDPEKGDVNSARFKALLELPALARSVPPLPSLSSRPLPSYATYQAKGAAGKGAAGKGFKGNGGKRPWQAPGVMPPAKRPMLAYPGRPGFAGVAAARPTSAYAARPTGAYAARPTGAYAAHPSNGAAAAALARARLQQQTARMGTGAFRPGVMHTQRGQVVVQPGFGARPTGARPRQPGMRPFGR